MLTVKIHGSGSGWPREGDQSPVRIILIHTLRAKRVEQRLVYPIAST